MWLVRFSARLLAGMAPLAALAGDAITPPIPIVMYFEDRPPLTLDSGKGLGPGGLVGKPATDAIARAGLPVEFRQTPFMRHMALIEQNQEAACAIGRFKTAERERLGKFSRPVFRDGQFVALLRSGDEPASLAQLLARPGLRLLVREGYSYGPALDAAVAASHVVVHKTFDSNANMLRMLANGMSDLIFASEEEAAGLLADNAALRGLVAVRRLPDMPPGEYRYFFCSRQVPDAAIARLNAALGSQTP